MAVDYQSSNPDSLYSDGTNDQSFTQLIEIHGLAETFNRLIAVNDQKILGHLLDNGREIANQRALIYNSILRHWIEKQVQLHNYKQPFAVVALGGTGRMELTPCSDTDYAFLFDDSIEGNPFLLKLQEQLIHTNQFRDECGFATEALPFSIDDLPGLDEKQINSFIDMIPVYDPHGLTQHFRNRLRETYDPFEHFLLVSQAWRDNWGQLSSKNEQLDRFNIKGQGLRVFLAGIWTLAGEDFCHSHEIYSKLEDPRDLEAYSFLLRIRSFIHLYKGTHNAPNAIGDHVEDEMGFDDFMAFGELAGKYAGDKTRFEFANEVRSRFLAERKRVDQFAWRIISSKLREGRKIRPNSAIVYGIGGLRDQSMDRATYIDKSRASLAILLASQRYDIPVDPYSMERSFLGAEDWMQPVPEFAELFYESRGSFADSLKFLSQIPNLLAKLLPGYSKFESSIDERVLTEQTCLRGALVREKLRALETDLEEGQRMITDAVNPTAASNPETETSSAIEAALLDDEQLAAIRLAITTKRLPITNDDLIDSNDPNLPLHERYSSGFSGIPIDKYYQEHFLECGFHPDVLEITEFLVTNRGAFKRIADTDIIRAEQVDNIIDLCNGDEGLVRTLYVFTISDRANWKSPSQNPSRWFNIHTLYEKTRQRFRPKFDPTNNLSKAGFDHEQIEIIRDFGSDFLEGRYRMQAIKFASHLFRLKEDIDEGGELTVPPKVARIRIGASEILGIATHDFRGIAASISGVFWKQKIPISRAHLFSAKNFGLALDFFHLVPSEEGERTTDKQPELIEEIAKAIAQKLYITSECEAGLPDLAENVRLVSTSGGHFRLTAESEQEAGALIYFLTCKAFRRLGANVQGLTASSGKRSHASVTLKLPASTDIDFATEEVTNWERKKT